MPRLLSLLVVVIGIITASQTPVWGKEQNLVVSIFDISESTGTVDGKAVAEVRKQYVRDFGSVLKESDGGDCLFGLVVSEASAGAQYIFQNECLHGASGIVTDPGDQLKLNAQKIAIQKAVQKRLQTDAPGTDIFGSLRVAGEIFGRFPDRRHILIIFSDMIQVSPEQNMAKRHPQSQDVTTFLSAWERNHSTPQLKGVTVYVWGAKHPDEKVRLQIKDFWQTMFEKLRAKLVEYAPQAINYQE